jgi:hypothetical protein
MKIKGVISSGTIYVTTYIKSQDGFYEPARPACSRLTPQDIE